MADTARTHSGPVFALDEDEYNALLSVRDQLLFATGVLSLACTGGTSSVPVTPDQLYAFLDSMERKMVDVMRGVDARVEDGRAATLLPVAPSKAKSRRAGLVRTATA